VRQANLFHALEQARDFALGLRDRAKAAPVLDAAKAVYAKASPVFSLLEPWIRAHLQFLGLPTADAPEEPGPVELVLADLDRLDPDHRGLVAKNLSLLWTCFIDAFGGLSGFLQAPTTEQAAYLDKLEAAAQRMESVKAPQARHHYVCVALMKHYVASFLTRTPEPGAIELSRRVAAMIDEAHRIEKTEKLAA
jgi:hypothetical protein